MIMNVHSDEQIDLELQQAERRGRLLQAANQVGKQANAITKLDELLPKTVDIICDAYGFYYAGIFLMDSTGKWATLRAGHGAAGSVMIAQGHKLEIGGDSMIGKAMREQKAVIALDVGEERVHFKNPLLPHTRSEMALPLMAGGKVLGAVTVQSIEPNAFSDEDILTLQTMADHLGIAINNAQTLKQLELANAELLRTKTFEALTASTTQAIHWIGNKAVPITTTVARMKADLAADDVDSQSLAEDLELIDKSAQQIIAIKENLLGPAREQRPRPVMLADIIQSAAFHAGVPAMQLSVNVAPYTPYAWADSTQLTRAIANLLRNALEADANRVLVDIRPADESGLIQLEISDDGAGIPSDQIDTVWAAFVTTKDGHLGLGLPAVLHVINQHQGQITINSQSGKGTTVSIVLKSVEIPNFDEITIDGPEKILLLDDDDPWSQLALNVLQKAGKEVELSNQLTGKPDLVLIDEAFETTSVLEALDEVKAAGLIDRTIVLSAALLVEWTTNYLQSGIKNAVLKPYTPSEFAAILSS